MVAILILLIVAIFPVYLIGLFLYKRDKDRESGKLLSKLFFGGFLSIVITLILTKFFTILFPFLFAESSMSNLIGLAMYIFIGVALIEEFSKWIVNYKISYNNPEFHDLYDSILYATFVALGFACFENILYVFQNGIITGLMRAVTAVPGHVFDGVFLGYYLGLAKINSVNSRKDHVKKNLIFSLLIPTITHGLYDYLLYSFVLTKNLLFILLALIFVILLYIYCIKRIFKVSKLTGSFNKQKICSNCKTQIDENAIFCTKCGFKQ